MYKKLKNSKIKTEQFFKKFCSVFCIENFCHSLCIFLTVLMPPYSRSRRVALVIRNNVLKQRLPKSTDPYLIESHARLTRNRQYKKLLEERINEIKKQKTQMRPQLENGGHYLCEKP